MSSRQIRRLQEKLQAVKLEAAKSEEKDEACSGDFAPLYCNNNQASYDLFSFQNSAKNEKAEDFAALDSALESTLNELKDCFSLLNIETPDEAIPTDDDDLASNDQPDAGAAQRKKRNNRKKKNKRRDGPPLTGLDEVSRALAEVNFMLGDPPTPPPRPKEQEPEACARRALTQVNYKFLNPLEELTRRFGPDQDEPRNQRPKLSLKRQIIFPNEVNHMKISGITMIKVDTYKGQKYFKFVHNKPYQSLVRGIIENVKHNVNTRARAPDFDVHPNTTLEGILQNIDLYFKLDETNAAVQSLEGALSFIQGIAHTEFSFIDGKTFFEYDIIENRPYHILLLKYIHVLTNKACHRTALEIAKVLLNFDPSDPLAVIFIIDTLALRAREHRWLVDIYKHWKLERDVEKLFHMLYSHALAKYHLYLKSKEEVERVEADRHLKDALILYPNVAVMLLDHCKVKCPEVAEHELFSKMTKKSTSDDLRQLQQLYVALAGPKWRENNNILWLKDNALRLCKEFDSNSTLRFDCNAAMQARHLLFKENPIEVKRHMFVIKSMSNFLVDGAAPNMKETFSSNPYPERGRSTDVYGYYGDPAREPIPPHGWRSFLESMVPSPSFDQIYEFEDDFGE